MIYLCLHNNYYKIEVALTKLSNKKEILPSTYLNQMQCHVANKKYINTVKNIFKFR